MSDLLCKSLKTTRIDASVWRDRGEGLSFCGGKYIHGLTLKDQAESVFEDVVRIKFHSLVPADIPVYGFVYDVIFRQVLEVLAANADGWAKR